MTQTDTFAPLPDIKHHTRSLLPILLNADPIPKSSCSPYPITHPLTKRALVPFHLTHQDYQLRLPPIGIITMEVLEELGGMKGIDILWVAGKENGCCDAGKGQGRKTCQRESDEVTNGKTDADVGASTAACVFFSAKVNERGKQGREDTMKEVMETWRRQGKFPEAMKHWMDEPFPIFASPKSSAFEVRKAWAREPFSNIAFEIERAGAPLFGFQAFGVHLTAYEYEGDQMKLWIPRRSLNMWRFPLKFDSTVAGGLPARHTPMEGLLKECEEEASWPEVMVRKYVKSVGMVTYFEVKDDGSILPNTEYTYDLPMPPRDSPDYVAPQPNDHEVDSFELYPVHQVIQALHDNEFKPSSAVATIDFLVRHGFVSSDNEPNFGEVVRRLHRWLGVAGPGL